MSGPKEIKISYKYKYTQKNILCSVCLALFSPLGFWVFLQKSSSFTTLPFQFVYIYNFDPLEPFD